MHFQRQERATAMVVYAKVQHDMVDDICAAVDTKLQSLLSTLPDMSMDWSRPAACELASRALCEHCI